MDIPFTKMHGLGNDLMVVDCISHAVELTEAQIKRLGDRHFGVGFDQLLQILPPSDAEADFDYKIFNNDGNEVEHCGNGARCFARYVVDSGLTTKNPIKVRTLNRLLSLEIHDNGEVSVDMGCPQLAPADIPLNAGAQSKVYQRIVDHLGKQEEVRFSALSMGNPHAVVQVASVDCAPVTSLGPALANHRDFEEGVNVGFMEVVARDEIRLRVFERGAGETLACGTGACAAVVAGILTDKLDARVKVRVKGGEMFISWAGDDAAVIMTGPAETVYDGLVRLS